MLEVPWVQEGARGKGEGSSSALAICDMSVRLREAVDPVLA